METTARVPLSSMASTVPSKTIAQRITSVDVYRGLVMVLMMGEVLSLNSVSKALPSSGFWSFLAFNQEHVEWVGCSLHDLIQPSFSFLVGVALPFSVAGRLAKGATYGSLLGHTIKRSLILIFLGIFLRSMYAKQTYFTFEDTLTQIGLGYTFLFLISRLATKWQVTALVLILFGYWLAFALYPLPSASFDYTVAGVQPDWPHNLSGFAAHWNKNTNLAWAFDRWFLNLFPREHVFTNNNGGYATLSFIPTLGTMILGLFAGKMLRADMPALTRLKRFVVIGGCLIAGGVLLHYTGVNPIVKRIWTPAWVLFSGGCAFLLLALFYGIVDIRQHKKWSYPLMVIGMNSIAAYVMAHTLPSFISSSFDIHLGSGYKLIFGAPYATLIEGALILLVEFLILNWMYKKKIFIKI